MGDIGTELAEGGAELDSPCFELSPWNADPIEPRCDLLGNDDCGVHSLPCEVVDSRRLTMGRNRSRVKSNISEPMAPMAAEYRSLLILDSLTMKSAKRRTRSASSAAAASSWAKI